jgi:hypothetical protein
MKKMLGMAVMALALAACGGGGGGGGDTAALACNIPADGGCFVMTMPGVSTSVYQAAFNSQCSTAGGSASSSCPSASRVGRCTYSSSESGVSYTIVFSYYSPKFTTATAQADCVGAGTSFQAN